MNKTEQLAHQWLIGQGNSADAIRRGKIREADFSVNGQDYEVKKIVNARLLEFSNLQYETFKTSNPMLLIYKDQELVDVVHFKDLNKREYAVNVKTKRPGYTTVAVHESTTKLITNEGKWGEPIEDIIIRIFKECQALREEAKKQ